MQAVIMAGGKGTRLTTITGDTIPKPLVPIDGKPLIAHAVEKLIENDIRDIIVCVGYLGDQIIQYLSQNYSSETVLTFVREEEPLGTAGALALAKPRIHEEFVLIFADLLFDVDLSRMEHFHQGKKACATLLVHPNDHPFDSDWVLTDDNGCVEELIFKPHENNQQAVNLVNAGIVILSPEALSELDQPRKLSLEKDLIQDLIDTGKPVYAYRTPEYVRDAGTPERLRKAEWDYRYGRVAQRNLKRKQKAIFLDRDGTINRWKGLITIPEQIELLAGAAEAIRKINYSDYLAIVVTNQPVIARGDCTLNELDAIHHRLYALLGEEEASIDDLIYCPHHPDAGYPGEISSLKKVCSCRKPTPGMLLIMAEKYNIDLNKSWIIGDTARDIQTGINAGTHTALVRSPMTEPGAETLAELHSDNLLNAITSILSADNDKRGAQYEL